MKLSHSKKIVSKQASSINRKPHMCSADPLAQAADVITVAKAVWDVALPLWVCYLGYSRSNTVHEVKCNFKTLSGTKCKQTANIIQGEFNGIEQKIIQCTKVKHHVRAFTDHKKAKRLTVIIRKKK